MFEGALAGPAWPEFAPGLVAQNCPVPLRPVLLDLSNFLKMNDFPRSPSQSAKASDASSPARRETDDALWQLLAQRPEIHPPGDLSARILREVRLLEAEAAAKGTRKASFWAWAGGLSLAASAAAVMVLVLRPGGEGGHADSPRLAQSPATGSLVGAGLGAETDSLEPEEIYPEELGEYLEAEALLASATPNAAARGLAWDGGFDWLME